MTIRILLDHGVPEEHIVFLTFLVARIGGIDVLRRAFPKVRIITGAIDDEVKEIWMIEGGSERKDWQVLPGLGDIGASIMRVTFDNDGGDHFRESVLLNSRSVLPRNFGWIYRLFLLFFDGSPRFLSDNPTSCSSRASILRFKVLGIISCRIKHATKNPFVPSSGRHRMTESNSK
jgi:hypothetical protein